MSSFVSEHIINPVLRQARRLSDVSRITSFASGGDQTSARNLDVVTSSDDSDHESAYTDVVSPDSPNSRPLTSSTQETRVEEAMPTPVVPGAVQGATHDHLGFPLTSPKQRHLPEDDGMRVLRTRIQAIDARDLSQGEKGRLMHDLLLENYNASRADLQLSTGPQTAASILGRSPEPQVAQGPLESLKFWQNASEDVILARSLILSDADKEPTYAPIRPPKGSGVNTPNSDAMVLDTPVSLGCQHYERNVKSQCFTCEKWYTCRLCHDAVEDHKFPFFDTRYMLCMLCTTPQKVSDVCINCNEIAAQYYCNICKLWENRQSKPIYHCGDCGICRKGRGLGKDYVHCKTCCACIPTSIETSHKCIERSTDCDCPICGDYMFTSPERVVFMRCGHSIHRRCYEQHLEVSYKCPICNKSLTNMESQFRNLDLAISSQPMPSEFRDTKAVVLCNDCSGKSTVPYHWLGLKCSICLSYNTVELQILGGDSGLQAALVERATSTTESSANAPVADTRPSISTSNRRRHSSRAIEIPSRRPSDVIAPSDAIAGSCPPVDIRHETSDNESDDGMLGFWGDNRDDGSSEGDDESDEEHSEMSDLEEEDEDEDEDNGILLIGHR